MREGPLSKTYTYTLMKKEAVDKMQKKELRQSEGQNRQQFKKKLFNCLLCRCHISPLPLNTTYV